MGLLYTEKYHVRGRDVDRNGVMSLATLARLLLQVSGQQTDDLNETYGNAFQDSGLTWFILQHDMTITRLPQFNDVITIETEALAYNRFFTHRRFKVWCNEVLIVETLMRFAVVDIVERKLVRIQEKFVSHYQASLTPKLDAMTKFTKLESSLVSISHYETYYSHIDINQHVNNAVYLDWVVDSLDSEFLQTHTPKKVTIIYENEVRLGDKVSHTLYQDNCVTQHYLENEGKNIAKAQIEWHV